MRIALPALNLKAKLIALMVTLLTLTLGTEIIVSLRAQDAISRTTEKKVRDLARAIQISVDAVDETARKHYLALAVSLEDMAAAPLGATVHLGSG